MRSCDIEINYRNYFNKMAITNFKKNCFDLLTYLDNITTIIL